MLFMPQGVQGRQEEYPTPATTLTATKKDKQQQQLDKNMFPIHVSMCWNVLLQVCMSVSRCLSAFMCRCMCVIEQQNL